MVAVATVAVGLWRDAHGTQLGVPHPPFIGAYGIRATWWLIPTVPAFVAAVALVRPVLRLRGVRFAVSIFAGTLILRVLLGAVRQGTFGWHDMFDVLPRGEGKNEYLPSLAAFDYGARFFLDRFSELVPALPVHSAGHPPGLLLVMHYAHIDTADRLAWFCILVGALSAPLTYVLARQPLRGADRPHRRRARRAVARDAALRRDQRRRRLPHARPAGRDRAAAQAVARRGRSSPWSRCSPGRCSRSRRGRRSSSCCATASRPALKLSIACAVATIAFQGGLALATGWDPIGTLQATSKVYELGIASRRPYSFWLFGSPTAFLLILGAPIAWLAARRLPHPEATAIFAVLAVATIAGFTKAETERIWLFLVPFVCLAAAPLVKRPTVLAALLAVQAVVYEVVFDTLW